MFNRRGIAALAMTLALSAGTQAAPDTSVDKALEAYRSALLSSDKARLSSICADAMSYGHSSGKVQDKDVFVSEAIKSHWNSITFSEVTSTVAGSNAISRFIFSGENVNNGQTATTRFGAVIVWTKTQGKWKILVRQGYKL